MQVFVVFAVGKYLLDDFYLPDNIFIKGENNEKIADLGF